MLASAYEPTAIRSLEESQTKSLFLTPRKVKARTELRPGVGVSKEIGNCTSAKIAENAHCPPKPRRLQAAAVAECKEGFTIQHVVSNKHVSAGCCADESDVVCCCGVNTWQDVLQVVVVL